MKDNLVTIGSRASRLALTQTNLIADKLRSAHPGLRIEIKTIKTAGDKILDVALSKIGGKGLFTKEIEEALLADEIDLAVHSMKDIPTEIPRGLTISAVTERLDAGDVIISSSGAPLEKLKPHSRIGTSSLRRKAQILYLRGDCKIVDLRGNLDTRVRKLEEGLFDAIIVAAAGLKRLGLQLKTTPCPIDILPQAGQGALGIETREGDIATNNLVEILDDTDSHLAVLAERAVLEVLGGGCQVPIGVYASIAKDNLRIKAGVFSLDGKTAVRSEISGNKSDASGLGKMAALELIAKGAKRILDELCAK